MAYERYCLNLLNENEEGGCHSEVLDFEINKRNKATLGYQYVLKDVAFAFLNTTNLEFILDEDKTVLQTHSLYGNYLYKNPKLFDIEVGARTTYFQELETFRFEPRLLLYKNLLKM